VDNSDNLQEKKSEISESDDNASDNFISFSTVTSLESFDCGVMSLFPGLQLILLFMASERFSSLRLIGGEIGESLDFPFKCEVCDKSFIHRHHLTIHSRMHSTNKPYTCKICKKEFAQTSHLYKHIRQHTEQAGVTEEMIHESLATHALLNDLPQTLQV
jgi:uncharacterized Zn-finger protein